MSTPPDHITIRPFAAGDAAAMAAIYNRYITATTATFEQEPVTAGEMQRRMESASRTGLCLVAECPGRGLAGYCYAHPWKEKSAYSCTLETTVYLDPAHTSRGIGLSLMTRLIEECRRLEGCHSLIACITTENEGSLRFHRRLGFTEVSHFRSVGYKMGRYLDVTDMQLML